MPVGALFDAWADAGTRNRWLNDVTVKVRTATKPRSMRLDWEDGSIIAVGFSPKGRGKSVVAIEQTGLASPEAAAQVKTDWAARFAALAGVLAAK